MELKIQPENNLMFLSGLESVVPAARGSGNVEA